MGLLHLLIAALAASAVMAADKPCACVNPDQQIDPINRPMIFFQQPTLGGEQSGVACSMNCEFYARLDTGADDYSLQIQLLTNSIGTGSITVDGMSGDRILISSNTPPQTFAQKSYGENITLHFTEESTNTGVFMLVVNKVKGRPEAPVTKPSTVAPVTSDYDHKFNNNPLLVSNDIMFALDMSSKDIERYKKFAQDIIKELTINPKDLTKETEDCGAGSRLSVVGLTSISGFTSFPAPYWTATDVQAIGNIGSMFQLGTDPYYYTPIHETYAYGFSKAKNFDEEKDVPYTTCKNRGKILVLLTSSPPVECNMEITTCGTSADVPITPFVDLGVHQILVSYNMAANDKKFYDLYNGTTDDYNVWNYFPLSGTDDDIKNFFNNYLVDSIDQMTCQLKQKTKETTIEIGQDKVAPADEKYPTVNVDIPRYYGAKRVSGGNWDTPRHYCNFQQTTVQFIRDSKITENKKIPICVKVFYDLETGKDFVSIYSKDPTNPDNDKEVVRLTGSDVSGTIFELPDAFGSIVFSSDEKNVFDGFHAEITRKDGENDCA